MKKIYTLVLLMIFTLSANAYSYERDSNSMKYSQLKNSLYLKKLEDKRDAINKQREVKESIYNYKKMVLASK